MVTLKEARNIRFADFVQPGHVLTVTAEITRIDAAEVHLKTQGTVAGNVAVGGRLVLARYNLADTRPDLAPVDDHLKRSLKAHFALVYQPLSDGDMADESALIAAATTTAQSGAGKI